MSIDVDDSNTTAITYSGSWTQLTGGPSQEWQGTAHSTSQNGASATIKFQGTRIILKCTVPEGSGSMIMNSNLDGSIGGLTRHSHDGTTYYDDLWFDSHDIDDGDHTLVISNGGGTSDSPLQLDRFTITGTVKAAIQPPPPPPSSSVSISSTTTSTSSSIRTSSATSSIRVISRSSTSDSSLTTKSITTTNSFISSSTATSLTPTPTAEGDKTIVSVQYITTTKDDGTLQTQVASHASSSLPTPIGAIVGGVLGGLAVLLLLLLALLCIRRRKTTKRHIRLPEDAEKFHRSTGITPFQLELSDRQDGAGSRTEAAGESNAHHLDANSLQNIKPLYNQSTPAIGLACNISHSTDVHSSEENIGNTTGVLNEKDPALSSENWTNVSSMYTALDYSSTAGNNNTSGPHRPGYLSGDTIVPPFNPMLYTSSSLALIDSTDVPPSYHQSASNRDSFFPVQAPAMPRRVDPSN